MSESVIELRQQDGRTIQIGEYENILSREITINDGDTVMLKQAFIDTKKSNSNQILIEEDITLKLYNGVYLTDWFNGFKEYFNQEGNNTGTTPYDGRDYVAYMKKTNGNAGDFQIMDAYEYYIINRYTVGPFKIIYQYVDIYGFTQTFETTFPAINPLTQGRKYIDKLGITYKTGTFQLLHPTNIDFNHMEIEIKGPIIDPNPVNEDIMYPSIFTTEVQISAGIYDPNDLGDIISKKLSATNSGELGTTPSIINSNFLMTNNSSKFSSDPLFINDDLSQAIAVASNSGFLIGSEQIALSFNSTTNKFQWDYLHSPMRDNVNGQDISVRYLYKGINNTTSPIMAIGKNGGIFFTGLSAVITKTNKFYDFWSGKLGFDLQKMLVVPTKTDNLALFGYTGRFYQTVLQESINTTNGWWGLDSAILKNTPTGFVALPQLDQGINGITSTISDTTAIIASNTLNDIQNRYSHFIVNADLKFNNNVFGKDIYKQVQSIVTKYYSFQGNYTYGDSSGSVFYQHKGAPIILKSIKTRITKSDKSLDRELGNDSTVYFQIIRAPSGHRSK
jgi:hypothetical protein